MALVGNIKIYNSVQSETETETIQVTYPSNLPEDHPKYELRGQTVDEEIPLISEEITLHNNVYVHIHSVNFWKIYDLEGKQDLVNINYKVFESKQAREENPHEFILEDHLIGQKLDFNVDTNQMEKCYEYVKNIRGFEELVND